MEAGWEYDRSRLIKRPQCLPRRQHGLSLAALCASVLSVLLMILESRTSSQWAPLICHDRDVDTDPPDRPAGSCRRPGIIRCTPFSGE